MRIQHTSRLITISVVMLSALMVRQVHLSQEQTSEQREALVASEDLSI